MMVLVFALPILTGCLVAHLLWPDRELQNLVFKAFLGIGLGLGIGSISYFLYLFPFAARHVFLWFQVGLFLVLLFLVIRHWIIENRPSTIDDRLSSFRPPEWHLSRLQYVFGALGAVVFLISISSTAGYILRRKQGDWDAWMMYNRAARFVYLDQAHWLGSFSPQMDPIFHADYPLFLAMNIASGWDTLGQDTPHVPMIESALFAVGCLGLLVSALATIKSTGQAALGLIIFWGTPAVVTEGSRELADLPLAYFFLATVILIYLYTLYRRPGLLVMAGLTTGFAAWMKNEGSVFVLAALLGLGIAFLREKPWRILLWFLLGLAIPLAVVLYFKLFLAPPSDVLSSGPARSLQQALDPSRHLTILQFFWQELLTFGGWNFLSRAVGVIPILLIAVLLLRSSLPKEHLPAYMAAGVILFIQFLGYYGVYVITPYDLKWHLSYSIERIFVQLFPMLVFLALCAGKSVESIFSRD